MAGVVPPWGVEGGQNIKNNNAGFRNDRADLRGGRFVPGRAGVGDIVSSALELRQASILSERNILLDELIQVKKELQLAQMETRRMGEAFLQRLGVVESRVMAGEANTRTLDKREAGGQQTLVQSRSEMELKIREMVSEVGRFKQNMETEVRGQMDVVRSELKQRDTAMLQVEAQAREWVRHSRNSDEQRTKTENELKASVEKRLLLVQDATRKMEASHIGRIAGLERLLQKEVEERVAGDEQTSRGFEDAVNILRNGSEREELAFQKIQEDLRSELDGVVQATQSHITAFRAEAERGRARLEVGLEEERSKRIDSSEEVKRKLDTFMKLYEVERVRLRDATRSALEQMTQRTKAVQEVSKSMQQEGVRIKLAAARVEQQAMGGLKSLTEQVEDGFHVLRAVQDRHALQIQDNRQAGSSALQDLRDKVQQGQARVQAELDKNFREDRQMRQDLNKRIDDCDEAAQRVERRLSHAHQELDDSVRQTLETVGKDVETLRFRTTTSLSDVEGKTHEMKQRVHSIEVLSEQRFAGHSDDIRTAHAKMWDEILHVKSNARGMAAVDQELRVANNLHLQKLAAVVKRLGGSLMAFERGARVAQPVEALGKETAGIQHDLQNDAEHIQNIQARGQTLVAGEAERDALQRAAVHPEHPPAADSGKMMNMTVDLSATGAQDAMAAQNGLGDAFDKLGADPGGGDGAASDAGKEEYGGDEFAEDDAEEVEGGQWVEDVADDAVQDDDDINARESAATAIQQRARGTRARKDLQARRELGVATHWAEEVVVGEGGEGGQDAAAEGFKEDFEEEFEEDVTDGDEEAVVVGEATEEERSQRTSAAVKIQSRARGSAVRRRGAETGDAAATHDTVAEDTVVQDALPTSEIVMVGEKEEKEGARLGALQEAAAVAIQKHARGVAARKRRDARRSGELPIEESESALRAHEGVAGQSIVLVAPEGDGAAAQSDGVLQGEGVGMPRAAAEAHAEPTIAAQVEADDAKTRNRRNDAAVKIQARARGKAERGKAGEAIAQDAAASAVAEEVVLGEIAVEGGSVEDGGTGKGDDGVAAEGDGVVAEGGPDVCSSGGAQAHQGDGVQEQQAAATSIQRMVRGNAARNQVAATQGAGGTADTDGISNDTPHSDVEEFETPQQAAADEATAHEPTAQEAEVTYGEDAEVTYSDDDAKPPTPPLPGNNVAVSVPAQGGEGSADEVVEDAAPDATPARGAPADQEPAVHDEQPSSTLTVAVEGEGAGAPQAAAQEHELSTSAAQAVANNDGAETKSTRGADAVESIVTEEAVPGEEAVAGEREEVGIVGGKGDDSVATVEAVRVAGTAAQGTAAVEEGEGKAPQDALHDGEAIESEDDLDLGAEDLLP